MMPSGLSLYQSGPIRAQRLEELHVCGFNDRSGNYSDVITTSSILESERRGVTSSLVKWGGVSSHSLASYI